MNNSIIAYGLSRYFDSRLEGNFCGFELVSNPENQATEDSILSGLVTNLGLYVAVQVCAAEVAVDELDWISVLCWEASFTHKLFIIRMATTTAITSKLYFALMCFSSIINWCFSTSPALLLYRISSGVFIIITGTLMLVVISRNTCNWITHSGKEKITRSALNS